MSVQTYEPDRIVDFGGLRCPHLVIATMKALDLMLSGQILRITATDLNAPSNMTAWCRQTEHQLLDLFEENGRFVFLIQKN